MPLDTTALWEVLQWSGCVLAAASLLPAVVLLCTHCAKRKPTAPSTGLEPETQMEQPSPPPVAELKNAGRSPDQKSQNRAGAVQQTQKGLERLGDVSMRQLPRIPLQEEKEFRRHSSYTSSSVYDVVSELRCQWPEVDRQKVSTGSHLREEDSFPVYAQVRKIRPTSPTAGDSTDLHLYAMVKKTGGRSVKSELIL